MARGHVYADAGWLTPERLKDKLAVIDAAGARHASFRFLAGELDPFDERSAFFKPGLTHYTIGIGRLRRRKSAKIESGNGCIGLALQHQAR